MKNINPKFKSPYFWLGLIAIVFASAGIDLQTLTSWKLVGDALLGIITNPYTLLLVVMGLLGTWNDNSSKGLDIPNSLLPTKKDDK